ncbi:phage tail assembly chaperone [Lacticaseibacillus hulanensis]|uniref:phage tail assembly chaperone n=1 Tax=Lacticaseibacillus hulanensis TaxID=2493111 RepID=UPI000FDBBBE3|nr:hypothetical protein [Lacticaseibacillus hulanensis]
MATSIEDFLMQNVGATEETAEVKFDRFKSPFVVRSLTEDEVSDLRKQATKRVKQKGMLTSEVDTNKFSDLMIAAAVVEPDINNSKLQASWGLSGQPVKMLKRMLRAGEYADLGEKVQELSGFDAEDVDDLAEEVKN